MTEHNKADRTAELEAQVKVLVDALAYIGEDADHIMNHLTNEEMAAWALRQHRAALSHKGNE